MLAFKKSPTASRAISPQAQPQLYGTSYFLVRKIPTGLHGSIMKDLRVSPIGVATSHTAAGAVPHSLYPAHFIFPAAKLEIDFASVVGVNLSGQMIDGKQIIALIGRDVLSMGMFVYNGSTSSFSLAI